MGDVAAYLATVEEPHRDALARVYAIAADVVPESVMPSYPWLEKTPLPTDSIQVRMRALQRLGVPYTDADIAGAPEELVGKTEEDAMVAYLQGLGLNRRNVRLDTGTAPAAAAPATDIAAPAKE